MDDRLGGRIAGERLERSSNAAIHAHFRSIAPDREGAHLTQFDQSVRAFQLSARRMKRPDKAPLELLSGALDRPTRAIEPLHRGLRLDHGAHGQAAAGGHAKNAWREAKHAPAVRASLSVANLDLTFQPDQRRGGVNGVKRRPHPVGEPHGQPTIHGGAEGARGRSGDFSAKRSSRRPSRATAYRRAVSVAIKPVTSRAFTNAVPAPARSEPPIGNHG
jgi:hypothetical protein